MKGHVKVKRSSTLLPLDVQSAHRLYDLVMDILQIFEKNSVKGSEGLFEHTNKVIEMGFELFTNNMS